MSNIENSTSNIQEEIPEDVSNKTAVNPTIHNEETQDDLDDLDDLDFDLEDVEDKIAPLAL